MARTIVAFAFALVVILPGGAAAQDAQRGPVTAAAPPRDISVSLSGGLAREVEDYFLTSPNWIGAVRSFSGGAGLGVWKQRGETLLEAQSLSDPTHHDLFTNTWNRTGIGAHGLASIDISITRRIQTFGAGRIEFVPQLDTLLLAVHGGVRVLF